MLTKPYAEVLQELVYKAIDLLNADASAIWILDGNSLILQATNFEKRDGEYVPLNESLAEL